MLRTVVCAGLALFLCGVVAAVVVAAEIRATITKVDAEKGTVTFKENKGKGQFGDEQTVKVDKDVKVLKGVFDKDTKTLKEGDPIEGGLKSETFTKIGDKGVGVRITTDGEGDKATITKIIVGGGRGGKTKTNKTD